MLPHAALVDVELRSLEELAAVWREGKRLGVLRIASWHRFDGCPDARELDAQVAAMHASGADLGKLAFRLDGPDDLALISRLLTRGAPLPLAVMGMGPLAPVSRLLAAQLGSVLNYGYLGHAPTAPGQWPAALLKEAIACSLLELP
jgi:3-dehydroquinate dehydratase-1